MTKRNWAPFWPGWKVYLYKKILLLGRSGQNIIVDDLERELRGSPRDELQRLSEQGLLIVGRDTSYFVLNKKRELAALLDQYLTHFKNDELGSQTQSPAEYYSYAYQRSIVRKLYFLKKSKYGSRLILEASDFEYHEMFKQFNLVHLLETVLTMELEGLLIVLDVRLNEIGWNLEIQALPKLDPEIDRRRELLDITVTDTSIMRGETVIHKFQRGHRPTILTKLLSMYAGEFVAYEKIAVYLGDINEGQNCDGPLKQDIRDMAERLNGKIEPYINRKLFEFNNGIKMTLPTTR